MKAQDKEFDELFSSKLNGLEIEPSADVWAGIDAGLNPGRRKRKLLPWLSIAASIVVLITAGILFIPKNSRVDPLKPVINKLAHNKVITPAVKPNVVPVNQLSVKTIKPESLLAAHRIAVVHQPKKTIQAVKPALQVAAMDKATTIKQEEAEPVLAAAPEKPADLIAVVPDVEIPLTTKQAVINETPDSRSKPVLAAVPPGDKAQQPVKKHRIRSFGDIVNLVVDKVDKRKDKIIVFTDTDDDESTVTALNIGPIKINK